MQKIESNYFPCQCHSDEHHFWITYDPDENELSLEVHLSTYRSFFKRLVVAVKYLFGYTCRYGHWDSCLIRHQDIKRLKDLCVTTLIAAQPHQESIVQHPDVKVMIP